MATVKEYYQVISLEEKLEEIKECIKRCRRFGNKEDEKILIEKYKKPVDQKIRELKLKYRL